MADYYLNLSPQAGSSEYEVRREGCYWLTLVHNRERLGSYSTCVPAVALAKRRYSGSAHLINGCAHCSSRCHTV